MGTSVQRLVELASSGRPRAVIVDLDSTLASGRWRWELMNQPIRDWAAWNGAMVLDAPIPHMVRRVMDHAARGDRIVILSMRPERFRDATLSWLRGNNIPFDEVHLRPEGAHGRTEDLKRDVYRQHIRDRYDVVTAYDDDPDNVEMWRGEGIDGRQVTDPGIPPLEGLPHPDPMFPSGHREYWGMGGKGVVFRDGEWWTWVLPHTRLGDHGLEDVDGHWRRLDLSHLPPAVQKLLRLVGE